jgi:ABC-type transport system substrate-binding protein
MVATVAVAALACGSAASPTTAPAAPTAAAGPTEMAGPTALPTVAPTATPLPAGVTSAQDNITLVLPEEPVQLNSFRTSGASLTNPLVRDNLVDMLAWQSGDDQRIVPTGATTGWEQIDADTWRFTLRQGVKFHDGEAWNAEAALPSLEYLGVGSNDNNSFPYTGGFQAGFQLRSSLSRLPQYRLFRKLPVAGVPGGQPQ